ncbi:SLATT domain-containing protein [Streptomyces cavourensis]
MVQPGGLASGTVTNALIQHRRDIADLTQRIKNRRLQVFGLCATPIVLVIDLLTWVGTKVFIWLHGDTPTIINGAFAVTAFVLALATFVQFAVEFNANSPWRDSETSVRELKLELALAEERHILEARRHTPPAIDRQASYKERIPAEIVRLRMESRHYRRLHLVMQWALFITSAAISAVTAWYDPAQPGKGILIGLGFTVTVITAASGYFKPRERAFNLQQTADSIEQHTTALELGISPYDATGEGENLTQYATVIEGLRADQRMREQQLDQPQQGQQQVI